jgi:hypothetical protein
MPSSEVTLAQSRRIRLRWDNRALTENVKLGVPAEEDATNHGPRAEADPQLEVAGFGAQLLFQLSGQRVELHEALLGEFRHSDCVIRIGFRYARHRHKGIPGCFHLEDAARTADLHTTNGSVGAK